MPNATSPMLYVDRLIFVVCIACAAFAGGMEVGQENQKALQATKCAPQAHEKLTVVVQYPDRVECVYATFYGRQLKMRRAS